MEYVGNVWIEDGIVKCASQLCEGCRMKEIYNCKKAIIICEEES